MLFLLNYNFLRKKKNVYIVATYIYQLVRLLNEIKKMILEVFFFEFYEPLYGTRHKVALNYLTYYLGYCGRGGEHE